MISTKKLIRMARKWQRAVALKRKRISFPRANASVAEKGHFVVYTTDKRRFSFPISYLSNPIFRELLEMSEQEFGLPSDGPITLPCDSVFLEYLVWVIQQHVGSDVEKALLISIPRSSCTTSCSIQQDQTRQQLLVF